MVLLHGQLVAHIAAVTVVAGLSPTHLANATLFTVINLLLFVFIVVESAYSAIVSAEVDEAALTGRRFRLDQLATATFNVGNCMSVDSVVFLDVHHVFIHDLIVAKTAGVGGSLANRIRTL